MKIAMPENFSIEEPLEALEGGEPEEESKEPTKSTKKLQQEAFVAILKSGFPI